MICKTWVPSLTITLANMTKEDEILKGLKNLQGAIEDLTKITHHQGVRQKRVEDKLLGDKEMRMRGLIDQVEDHEVYIDENEKRITAEQTEAKVKKAKQKGIIFGISLASGGVGAGIWTWIKSLIGY